MDPQARTVLYLPFSQGAPSLRSELVPDEPTWEVREATSPAAAGHLLETEPIRVAVAAFDDDYDKSALELIPEMRQLSPATQWIALVADHLLERSHDELAVCVAENFFDFLTWPIDRQRLLFALGHAHGMSRLAEQAGDDRAPEGGEEQIVGVSTQMQQLFRDIRKVAAAEAPIFISGESGTGKELTARAIHERSPRAKGPFVAVDCGALPPTLIQSELFGYERGAFTGAAQRRVGRIEAAQGGTIFLDEIGDLPLDLQANLLRFLQESTICRVGSTQPIPVNARVIAATHVDLEKAVDEGRFRQDLYFRLNVLQLRIPALRERIDDVEVLARFFFKTFARDSGKRLKGFTRRAVQAMRTHPWPGNVRELINRVRRAVVMCDGEWITPRDMDLHDTVVPCGPGQLDLEAARAVVEKETIEVALKSCGNNLSRAARALGVSRVTLYRLLDKYRLHVERQH